VPLRNKEDEMKANLKFKLLAVPILACTVGTVSASPIALDDTEMDRITAGALPTFDQIVSILTALPRSIEKLNPAETLILGREQWEKLIAQSSGTPITFRLLNSGELVAAQQLQSGEQLLIVKPLSQIEAASLSLFKPGDTVATYTLSPGESLQFQQTSQGGTNYMVVRSTGNSTITTLQKTGL
jgi:hypothetical protein